MVREVVKLNHQRNCLLCHAPGNTPESAVGAFGREDGVVTGPVPSPGQPIRNSSRGYDRFQSPDIHVRVDVTHLRQDFSLTLTMENAAPWPDQQRFDFLVRTREVNEDAAYDAWRKSHGAEYVAAHHEAAVEALRALTGRDAGLDTVSWRKALGL